MAEGEKSAGKKWGEAFDAFISRLSNKQKETYRKLWPTLERIFCEPNDGTASAD